ncbi:MAG: helix-turn-helix transcriptional regulator [Prevotella sp.]|mgnify:CR=1 FL=1|nr:helix-turn-helix transcriptional regulator [Prevotella sp.]
MKVTYNKLWKLMIDNHLMKKDLKEKANISTGTMAKISKNECVNLSIIVRICEVLNCDIGDIVEIVEE